MLSVPVISIIVCIRILLPDRRGVRSTIVLFLLFINVFIFYLHDEVQKSYIETAKQEEMKIQMSQYAKELEMMMKSQDRLNKIHHDYKHHLTTIGAMAKTGGMCAILPFTLQSGRCRWQDHCAPGFSTSSCEVGRLLSGIK